MTVCTRSSASLSEPSPRSGYFATIIDSRSSPSTVLRSSCQTASVTNGMNGCRSRMLDSSTRTSTGIGDRSPAFRRTLAISTYQSQYSFQKNSYSNRAASFIWNSASSLFVSPATRSNRERIQRSSIGVSLREPRSPSSFRLPPSSRFETTNLEAFQILFAKFRALSSLSSDSRKSFPGAPPVASVNRNASQPYLSIASSGSTTLPRLFVIFLPCASRMRPCRYT